MSGVSAHDDSRQLEAVLRAHTDIFETPRGVLAIAPEPTLHDALAAVPQIRYDRSGLADVERLHLAPESFDALIGDADALAEASHRPLRDLGRLLRPGGRLVLRVTPGRSRACTQDLESAGFLVVPAHADSRCQILLGVRGERLS